MADRTQNVGFVHVLTDDGECRGDCPHPVYKQAGFKSPPVSTPHGGPQEAGEGVGFPQASDPCGVVLGQQKGPGPGLFISCQNERPCPDHPMPHIGGPT